MSIISGPRLRNDSVADSPTSTVDPPKVKCGRRPGSLSVEDMAMMKEAARVARNKKVADRKAASIAILNKPKIPMTEAIEWVCDNLERPGVTEVDAPSAYSWTLYQAAYEDRECKRWFLTTYDAKRIPKVIREGGDRYTDSGAGIISLCDELLEGIE